MASENLDKRFELIQETFSNPEFNKKLENFSKKNNIEYLNKIDFLCDTKNQSCDAFDENGNITIMDSYHYTLQGAKFFGKKLYDRNMINF